MTEVEFLHGARERLQAAATWLARHAAMGRSVVVYVPQRADREHLDHLLWASPPTGFVPHCGIADRLAGETPILLAADLEAPFRDECLLNFSDEIPPGFSRFQRVVEIVSTEDEDRSCGRERYRFYRERGYPISARDFAESIEP